MPSTATGLDIHRWIAGLEEIPRNRHHALAVDRYVRTHLVSRESLEPYAFFHAQHYTRNLIHLSEEFEVIALCWGPGHASTIHNHREQNCWVVMAEGQLENLGYRVAERDPVRKTCKLEPATTGLITRAQPAGIPGDEPVHQIVNCPSGETPALSVHVYNKPFDTCEIYCPESGTFKEVKLSYWSVKGELIRGQAGDPCRE
jgi:cysteine dioxygenase